MVNKITKAKKNLNKGKKKMTIRPRPTKKMSMGPISAITTAPVAIGNSIKGSGSQVIQSKSGITVRSRDFMFNAIGSGAVQTWTVVGGAPVAPAVFASSTIRQFMQMYAKFKWKSLAVHYITSSSTSSTGDVMIYFNKNRESVMLNQTSSNLLPFVLNDDNTVIGPQWTNHSVMVNMRSTWKSTDYGMTSDLSQYAEGDIFLLSKTTTTDSPGYVLFDYEIEFSQLQIQPRLLSLPFSRAAWDCIRFGQTAASNTSGGQATFSITGNDISGATATLPSGAANGDIYKIFFDITNSASGSWTGVLTNTLFKVPEAGGFTPINLQDGTTLYAIYNGASFALYANPEAAYTGGSTVQWATTAVSTWSSIVWISLIGTFSNTNFNPNF